MANFYCDLRDFDTFEERSMVLCSTCVFEATMGWSLSVRQRGETLQRCGNCGAPSPAENEEGDLGNDEDVSNDEYEEEDEDGEEGEDS